MSLTYRALARLFVPILLLGLSAYLLSQVALLDESNQQLLRNLPYVITPLALILAHQFNRSRFFSATLLMALTFWIVQTYLQSALSGSQALASYTVLSLLIPLNFLLLIALPERGLWNQFGLAYIFTPLLQFVLCYYLFQHKPEIFIEVPSWLYTKPYEGYVLSIGASLWMLLVFVISLVILCWRNAEAEASLIGCLIASYAILSWLYLPMISTVLISAAIIGIIVGIFRSSHEMAYFDELTQILGRRAFNEKLGGLGRNYTIAMVDIDHFKKFNDTHGHDIGDDVLKMVATKLQAIKGGGTVYRYGGEEFCIVFNRPIEHCIPHLETLRENIATYKMRLRDKTNRPPTTQEGSNKRGQATRGLAVSVTISIGVATRTAELGKPSDVIKAADKALYQSKSRGRNCLSH